jgi:hypothetical protein
MQMFCIFFFVKHLATSQASVTPALSSALDYMIIVKEEIYWWQNVFQFVGYTIVLSCYGVRRLIAVSLFFFSDGT